MKLRLNRFEHSSRLESFAVVHVHEKEQVHACTVMSTIGVVTSNNTLMKVAIYVVAYLVLGQGVTIISNRSYQHTSKERIGNCLHALMFIHENKLDNVWHPPPLQKFPLWPKNCLTWEDKYILTISYLTSTKTAVLLTKYFISTFWNQNQCRPFLNQLCGVWEFQTFPNVFVSPSSVQGSSNFIHSQFDSTSGVFRGHSTMPLG